MPTVIGVAMRIYNGAHRIFRPLWNPTPESPELREIYERSQRVRNDICDHLTTIFAEAITNQPDLMVELGVRDGSSRFALERAAKVTDSALVSVDTEDCAAVCSQAPKWHFVIANDVAFANSFTIWCTQRGMIPKIDVLFIDTSHLYEHTLEEMRSWFPHLSSKAKVIFHDTNIKPFYRRLDGTIGRGWNNQRGVVKAIEDYLGTKFNETFDFVTVVNGWVVRHWSHCNGLTVLERIKTSLNDH